jgi:hypothetical protein
MAINACSINAFTIDAARCRRSNLFRPPVGPTFGNGNGTVRDKFAEVRPHLFDKERTPEPQLYFEQPFITVTAELLGSKGLQTVEAKPQLEFVVVTALEIGEPEEAQAITVNILDLSI